MPNGNPRRLRSVRNTATGRRTGHPSVILAMVGSVLLVAAPLRAQETAYALGNGGTILKTTDGGTNWNAQTSGTTKNLLGACFLDTQTGYATGESGTVLKTTDGGSNWVSQTSGTTNALWGVHFPDASTGWAVGNNGTIVKTTDGGANWNAQTSNTTEHLHSVHFPVDATTGYVVGFNGTILKTTDGGTNWDAQTSGTTRGLEGVWFPVDATTGWAVGEWGTILNTTNGGTNWNTQTTPFVWRLYSVHFPLDVINGWSVGLAGKNLKTTNGGTNWTEPPGAAATLRGVFFRDGTTGWAVGGSGLIVKTTDGAANWNAQTSGTTQVLWEVSSPPVGALTAKGSMICDSTRTTLAAIDASYTLTDNSDKIIFCAAAQDNLCAAEKSNGGMTLQYRELSGTWADVPTSNGSGPFLASAGTDLSNNDQVKDGERRCNSDADFRDFGKEFTSSTNLDYKENWKYKHTEAQWALDFSTAPGGKTYEFRVRWGTKDCGIVDITYPAQISTSSAHHWAMDETSGTVAADSLGSDGTLVNFPFDDSQWSCLNGGSLLFDGDDDYVSLPTESDYDFTSAVTVAAWVKVTSFSVADQAVVTKGDTAWRLERNGSTDTLQFSVDGLTTNTAVQGSVSVNDGVWHHVAGVYDGAELLLYVDGQLDNSVTATGTMDTNNSSVYFGDNAGSSARFFHGRMADVYIYDTALDAAAVLVLAQESLLGWWKLNETAGTTANDSSTYGYNGTLLNMDGSEWTTGKDDGGLDFFGSADYIETNVASDLATSITMMTWFKSDNAGFIGDNYVDERFTTQRRSSSTSRLALGINNDRIALYWYDGGHTIQEATTTVTAGKWYHAAVTYDGSTVRLYINGVEDGNWPELSMDTASTDTFQIGCHYSGQRHFDGVLDDVRLYKRGLCAAEVAAVYKQTKGPLRILRWREVNPY